MTRLGLGLFMQNRRGIAPYGGDPETPYGAPVSALCVCSPIGYRDTQKATTE